MSELFRKKPVVISAVQWDGSLSHAKQLEQSLGLNTLGMTSHPPTNKCSYWKIATLEDGHVVSPLDWVITGVKGEHYPCKPEIFALTYEPAEAEHDATVQSQGAEIDRLRSALNAMLTHMGMDEDEWNKPTFDQARAALKGQP